MVAALIFVVGTLLIGIGVGVAIWQAALAAFFASAFAIAIEIQVPMPQRVSSFTAYFIYAFVAGISALIAIQIAGRTSHGTQPEAIVGAVFISSGMFLWARLLASIGSRRSNKGNGGAEQQ